MKKIGILTHYYNSHNFGGVLQAYALQKKIENLGYDVKQIMYAVTPLPPDTLKKKIFILLNDWRTLPITIIKKLINKVKNIILKKLLSNKQDIINNAIKIFANSIPHTSDVFNDKNSSDLNEDFDIFITGSDQVWNLNYCALNESLKNLAYFLNFTDKYKISYAASIGVSELSDDFIKFAIPFVQQLNYISVREESAQRLLKNRISKKIDVVLDPTLILDVREWNEVVTVRKNHKECVFSYLLGDNKRNRSIAEKVSLQMGKSLVVAPYIGHALLSDYFFGDEQLVGITPNEFLGEIKEANLVITDSFHAVVFSVIFNQPFIALLRTTDADSCAINNRIYDLLDMLDLRQRLVDNVKDAIKIIDDPINYLAVNKIIEDKRAESIAWLLNAITNKQS